MSVDSPHSIVYPHLTLKALKEHVSRGGELPRAPMKPVWQMCLEVQGGVLRIVQCPEGMGATCSWPYRPVGEQIREVVIEALGYTPEDANEQGTKVLIRNKDAKKLVQAVFALVEGSFE